jgi:hypothetical protein
MLLLFHAKNRACATVWGFAADSTNTLQIQIFTEFYNVQQQPLMITNPLYIEQDPARRASMASPDFIDYTLDFGHYVFGSGQMYTAIPGNAPGAGVRIAKDFVASSGRNFLVESVPYMLIQNSLRSLPPVKVSSLKKPAIATKMKVAAASLPSLRDAKKTGPAKILPRKVSSLARPQGLVADYIVTVSSTVEPKLYSSDTTYFVSGTVYETSPVVMESAVFKFPTHPVGMIELESTLTLATTNYRPAIFTAADDSTAGATLSTNIWSGYTGNPTNNIYGNAGLYFANNPTNIALNNLSFRYLDVALQIDDSASGSTFALSHSQLVGCTTGLYVTGGGSGGTNPPFALTLNNCLIENSVTPVDTENFVLTAQAVNCTFDTCEYLMSVGTSSGAFNFTNCILSAVTNKGGNGSISISGGYNGFYISPSFGGGQQTNTSRPFQTVGAGNYYLSPANGAFLTNGTTGINAALLAQLQSKTVQAPSLLTTAFSANTNLVPVVPRDTNGTAFGFHYDALDYLTACSISGATLTLTNGVALGYYNNVGILLKSGGELVSQGTPIQRNYLVYYGLVQEQPLNYWGVSNALAQS